ncbi:MAG: ABC transporter substrate-binding protein, partial [Thermoprotei archaeon]
MLTLKRKRGLSTAAGVAIAVVVIIIIVAAAVIITTSKKTSTTSSTTTTTSTPPSTSTTSTTTSKVPVALTPQNSSVLVDDSQTAAPDGLDPAFGFFTQDTTVFNNVFQELVQFNGSSVTQLVPVLASSYTETNNYMNYTFNIRPNVRFSDGNNVTAADVWFSFVRELFDGQVVGFANYIGITMNPTYFGTGYAIPWGTQNAVAYATGDSAAATNATVMAQLLGNMLSHFNPNNATIQKLISYPHQAYVVTGPMTIQMNLLVHYS